MAQSTAMCNGICLSAYKDIEIMQLEFTLNNQSLETLCFNYVCNSPNNSQQTILINSILMHFATSSLRSQWLYQVFTNCVNIVEIDSENSVYGVKQQRREMLGLLAKIVDKYPKCVRELDGNQQLEQILKYCMKWSFCAVCGNESISLMYKMIRKVDKQPHNTAIEQHSVYLLIKDQLITKSNKLISSYKQITRLQLYRILHALISHLNAHPETREQIPEQDYLHRVLQLMEDEKDPRNISTVFQIYHLLLSHPPYHQILSQEHIRSKIFENLEMYYPIDFEGETSKHNIDLGRISQLLDLCLGSPILARECAALLKVKLASPPINQYIGLFCKCLASRGDGKESCLADDSVFLLNLLIKTAEEEEFLLLGGPESGSHSLIDLISAILQVLAPCNSYCLPLCTYEGLEKWLDRLLTRNLMTNQHNAKYSGITICIIKRVCENPGGRISPTLIHMVMSFTVLSFLNNHKNSMGDIIYKLGMLVPVLESMPHLPSHADRQESIGLLVISLTHLFYQKWDQQQPRLIILKIFMLINQLETAHPRIGISSPLLQFCYNLLSGEVKDQIICKAYIDFCVSLIAGQQAAQSDGSDSSNQQMENSFIQLLTDHVHWPAVRIYGLVTLMLSKPAPPSSGYQELLNNLIRGPPADLNELLKVLKMQKIMILISLLAKHIWNQDYQSVKLIEQTVLEKFRNLKDAAQQHVCETLQHQLTTVVELFIYRKIWRAYLVEPCEQGNHPMHSRVRALLSHQDPDNVYWLRSLAFYNQSVTAFKLNPDQLLPSSTCLVEPVYAHECHCMLPIDHEHCYTAEECTQWPTLTSYVWYSQSQLRVDLIEQLPIGILRKQSSRILPILIESQQIGTLSKLVRSLPPQSIIHYVLEFAIKYLEAVSQQTPLDNILASLKILADAHQRAEQYQQLKNALIDRKGRVLIAVEERLLQHRKRLARQSGRHIFSLFNLLK